MPQSVIITMDDGAKEAFLVFVPHAVPGARKGNGASREDRGRQHVRGREEGVVSRRRRDRGTADTF